MKFETPILTAVNEYNEKQFSRFHMPGHKGNCEELKNFISPKFDLTEVTGLDSLFEADGCILKAEEEIAEIYGAKRSLIGAGGSSQLIKTMLALALKEGDKVIMSRSAHTSAVNALALIGAVPYWVYPDKILGGEENGLSAVYGKEEIERAFESCPNASAVYITSPNYFGLVSDIEGIAKVCKRHSVPLIVDNAHGACLGLGKENLHPIALGASMCCDSFHKTLPALTGAAVLHIADERFIPEAKEKMTVFSSTSPSYLIMESIDYSINYLKTKAKNDYEFVSKKMRELKEIALEKGFKIAQGKGDEMRLCLFLEGTGYNGESFLSHLNKNKIEPELICDYGVCFMATGFNKEKDFENLKTAIQTAEIKTNNENEKQDKKLPRAKAVLTVREAFFKEKEKLKAENSVGKICGGFVCPCPPGIPIAVPGEEITKEIMKLFLIYGINEVIVVK